MKKLSSYLIGVIVLAAAGFAAASIMSSGAFGQAGDETTASTATSTTPSSRLVTVCHLTGSKKHPFVTISVDQHAVAAVTKNGGHVGACTGTETRRTHPHPHPHSSTAGSSVSSNASSNASANGSSHSGGNGRGRGK